MGATTAGLEHLPLLIAYGGGGTAFRYLATDSSATAFNVSQTTLVSENTGSGIDRAAATIDVATSKTAKFSKTWTLSGSKTVNAVGLFNNSSGGTMMSRDVLGATRSLVSGDSYTASVSVVFS